MSVKRIVASTVRLVVDRAIVPRFSEEPFDRSEREPGLRGEEGVVGAGQLDVPRSRNASARKREPLTINGDSSERFRTS